MLDVEGCLKQVTSTGGRMFYPPEQSIAVFWHGVTSLVMLLDLTFLDRVAIVRIEH